jgi:hypothetical protein
MYCGNEVEEGTKFCTKCGASVEEVEETEQSVPVSGSGGSKKRIGVIITIVSVVLVLALGVTGGVIYKQKLEEEALEKEREKEREENRENTANTLAGYIYKSRKSTDIQMANTIAAAIQTALSNERGWDDAEDCLEWTALGDLQGDEFVELVKEAAGVDDLNDYFKALSFRSCDNPENVKFYVILDTGSNIVQVAISDDEETYFVLYPTTDESFLD